MEQQIPLPLTRPIYELAFHILTVTRNICSISLQTSMTLSVGVGSMFESVCLFAFCLSVCPEHNSKTKDPKMFKLGINDLGMPTSVMVLGLNGQRSRSQGQ